MRRIVITGMGTVNPVGHNVESFWQGLREGRSGVCLLDWPELAQYHSRVGGVVKLPANPRDFFKNGKLLKRVDPYMMYVVIAGKEALSDSGIRPEDEASRIGIVVGTGVGGLGAHESNQALRLKGGVSTMHPMYVINAIPNSGVALLAQEMGCLGPSFALSSACASGGHAVGIGKLMIESGMADVMFVGGVEAALTPSAMGAFGNISALTNSLDPLRASRPFDRDRDGFVLSDGCGIVCLEELQHARKRGAQIYAELLSCGFSSDAYDMVAPHPEAISAEAAMRQALDQARLIPNDIELVNAHGTSTPMGDAIEAKAISRVFSGSAARVLVHSTKSMTGHTIGAAGCIEVISSVLALQQGIVHMSANLDNPDPEIRLNLVRETREQPIRYVLSNSFGFGGHNVVLILARWDG